MPMLLIAGTYRVLGAAPDGDSVRFYPRDRGLWRRVPGPNRVRPNATGGAQLRLDGIDTPETHYGTALGMLHQPLPAGREAATALLETLGFTAIERDDHEVVTAAEPQQVPGWILTRGADLHGRCVAIAGAGDPPAADGEQVFVDEALLRLSVNHRQLATGMAYPTFYSKLFADLRVDLAAAARTARDNKLGVWASDATSSGVTIESLSTITDDVLLWPKLWRRLIDYLALSEGEVSLAGLDAYLAARADGYLVLPAGQFTTGLDAIVEVDGQRLHVSRPVEDLVFIER